jgi:FixJ family two-component response regulator/signal transduction histidine kinase
MVKAKTRTAQPRVSAVRQFERLLAELSTEFINLPASKVDAAINDALRRIAKLLDIDRTQVIRFSAQGDDAHVTHSGAVDGVPAVPPKSIEDAFPWVLRRVRVGHAAVIPDTSALSSEAAVDRLSFQRVGARSSLCVPLRVAGRVQGMMAFGCLTHRRDWTDEFVERVSVLADVLGNALDHKRSQEALDAALGFEQSVSGIFAALLTAGRAEQDSVIESGLRDMGRVFGAERATLWQRTGDSADFVKTHRWLAPGVPSPPTIVLGGAIPWISARLVSGNVVRFARYADLPPEANADLDGLRALNIRAAIMVPLVVSGTVVGSLSFATAHDDCSWPDALIPRVKLVAEVFASTLARQASERREQEAQSQAAHAARVGSMGMLAASLVHELTQPLAASLANAESAAELLEATSPDLEELRATVADIVTDDRRVGELIQQLRRFLRRGATERAQTDLDEIIGDVLRIVAGEAAEKEIAVAIDVSADLPAIVGDRVQLQQVILNLLLNAMEAVATREPGARRIAVIAHASDEGVQISVSDTGPGMDEATAARVFQPFFTTKPGGMGLGLSISRSIVADHGGRLSVRSAQGEGTTFRIDLPLRLHDSARPAPVATPAVRATGAVYVVDDDPSMRRALERQLRSAGYRVQSFASAQAFLDQPPESGVACVLSDVRMPGLSGLDLQSSLATAQRDLPIVFISGHGDVSTTVHALKSGAVNFLAKPFTKQALLAAVAEALARSHDIASRRGRHGEIKGRHNALTRREREVFALVAAGLLNKVIAERLGAAEATIKIHRGRVMAKMGAASVAELARMAETLDLQSGSAPG